MRVRSVKGNIFERHKYWPSGVILAWLGNDDKVHTQSISDRHTSIGLKQVELDTRMELSLRQLDCIGGIIKSMPMVTFGLTRLEARQALLGSTVAPQMANNPRRTPVPRQLALPQ